MPGTFELEVPGGPATARGRVAYLLLTHRLPEQVLRLSRALRAGSPEAPIVIHHDTTGSTLDAALLAPHQPVYRLRSDPPPRWGDWSFVAAVLGSLDWIERRLDYDWVVVLSGQDYPLRPLAAIERALLALPADAAIGVEGEVADDPSSRGWSRYYWSYRALPRWSWPLARWPGTAVLLRRLNSRRPWIGLRFGGGGSAKLGWRALRTPFGAALRCYKGSLWGSYSRRAVRSLLRAGRDRPELVDHFRRTHAPDEGFVPTLLLNDPSLRIDKTSRRYIDWSRAGRHPRTLGLADLPRLLASGHDFARKFDLTVDAEILDALDRHLRPGA